MLEQPKNDAILSENVVALEYNAITVQM